MPSVMYFCLKIVGNPVKKHCGVFEPLEWHKLAIVIPRICPSVLGEREESLLTGEEQKSTGDLVIPISFTRISPLGWDFLI